MSIKSQIFNPEEISSCSLFIELQVKAVQETVKERREQHPDDHQENHTREEGIDAGKDLACCRIEGIYWAHSSQDHRGIHQRINPGKTGDEMVSQHSDQQRPAYHSHCPH